MNVLAVVRFQKSLRAQSWLRALLFAASLSMLNSAEAAVGRIGGSGSVSPMGAATYTIPIQVAAGINGLKPEIALAYDSQSGDGLAGIGWTLSGFSKIHRCPLTRPLDGNLAGGVTYTVNDRFCLDGTPLIQKENGTYGADNMEYRAEVHSYQKVVSKGTQGTGPSSFEVSLPNGLTYYYGNDGDSRILAPGTNNEVRVWALNAIKDKFNNQIDFTYASLAGGEYVPIEVTWNGGTAPYKLQFTYENLASSAVRGGYVWGSEWRATQQLKTIDYSFSGAVVHRYTLDYTSGSTGKSRLQSVQQCDGVGTDCLRATTFGWQDGSAGFGSEQNGPTLANSDSSHAILGDVNGDGATDIYIPVNGVWQVMYADPATGMFNAPVSIDRPFDGRAYSYPLDYDGDGRTDLLYLGSNGNFHVFLASLASPTGCEAGDCDTEIAFASFPAVAPIDINGDGLTDLAYGPVSGGYVRINQGASLAVAKTLSNFEGSYLTSDDLDGDGRQDLVTEAPTPNCQNCASYLRGFRSFWSGSQDDFRYRWIRGDFSWYSPPIYALMDLNGDSLSDYLVMKNFSGSMVSALNYGTHPSETDGANGSPPLFFFV